MVAENDGGGDKELKVVFEKKIPWYNEDASELEKTAESEWPCEKQSDINISSKRFSILEGEAVTKAEKQKQVVEIFANIDNAIERKETKIVNIVKALQLSHHRENLITDKFLRDVESMVTNFNTELAKMQNIFGRIMKNLPQVEPDSTVQPTTETVDQHVDDNLQS